MVKDKKRGFDVVRGKFDGIGPGFNVEFLESNGITPLES